MCHTMANSNSFSSSIGTSVLAQSAQAISPKYSKHNSFVLDEWYFIVGDKFYGYLWIPLEKAVRGKNTKY